MAEMSEPELKLAKNPIVEAVVDIDCDMPPALDLTALEKPARAAYSDRYPKFRTVFVEQHRIEAKGTEPSVHSADRAIQALQFLHDNERQLVQVRTQGFSFNRLTPYTSLDDYLPEIERTWRLFLDIATPVQVRIVRLRYINRILLPMTEQKVELEVYLRASPRLADDTLVLTGFLHQYAAAEPGTGHEVNVVLTAQPPDGGVLPVILDNCVGTAAKGNPIDWLGILGKIQSLRLLKNRIFRNTLTEQCLNLFQQ